jgi:hypothetical protein
VVNHNKDVISIVTIQQVLKTLLKLPSILTRLTTLKTLSSWLSKEKKPNNLSTKTTLSRWKFKRPRLQKKKDVKPYNTKQKCPRDEPSIRCNLIYKEINKRCNIRSRWQSNLGKLMNIVRKDKSR